MNKLIDDLALHRNRMRATRLDVRGADFLLHAVAQDMALRLSTIKHHFTLAVDLNSAGRAISDALGKSENIETVIVSRAPAFFTPSSTSLVTQDDGIPFANGKIDLIASALTLQFINDLPGVLVQIRRALKPDGLFMGALIGGRTLFELRQSFLGAEAEMTDGARPRVLPFIDVRDAGNLLQRAGFSLPVTDVDTLLVRYDTMFDLMHDLRFMGATNCLTERNRRFMRKDILMKAAEIYARDHADADGRIRATFEVISLSGWSPHESQQKPLKPGSAEVSLTQVLKSQSGPL